MESVSPVIQLLWSVRRSIEKGQAVQNGIQNYLLRCSDDEFSSAIKSWWDSRQNPEIFYDHHQLSFHRRHLIELLEVGLSGQPIAQQLQSLENELVLHCENAIRKHIALLPIISLLPLLLFIFPSMVLLILWPLLGMLRL